MTHIIMQWRHLDTLGRKTMVEQKQSRPDGGDTNSGRQETHKFLKIGPGELQELFVFQQLDSLGSYCFLYMMYSLFVGSDFIILIFAFWSFRAWRG